MTSTPTGFNAIYLTAIKMPPWTLVSKDELPDDVRARLEKFSDMIPPPEPPSPEKKAETEAAIAMANAVKVHTVWSVDGNVVGVHEVNGLTTFIAGPDVHASSSAKSEAQKLGLTGDALNEFVTRKITDALKAKYGDALEVSTYDDPATAPATGDVVAKMYQDTPEGPKPSLRSLLFSSSPEALDLLNGTGEEA